MLLLSGLMQAFIERLFAPGDYIAAHLVLVEVVLLGMPVMSCKP
jgi:hypothetical protein